MLPPGRYLFCGTFRHPGLNPASRTLSGTLLCGVRTFRSPHLTRRERPSGPAANWFIIFDADFGMSSFPTTRSLLLDSELSLLVARTSRKDRDLISNEHRRSHPHRP